MVIIQNENKIIRLSRVNNKYVVNAEFKESEHPRDEDGRFTGSSESSEIKLDEEQERKNKREKFEKLFGKPKTTPEEMEKDLDEIEKILSDYSTKNKPHQMKKDNLSNLKKDVLKKYKDVFEYNKKERNSPRYNNRDLNYFQYGDIKRIDRIDPPDRIEKDSSVRLYADGKEFKIPLEDFDVKKFTHLGFLRQKKENGKMVDFFTKDKNVKSDNIRVKASNSIMRIFNEMEYRHRDSNGYLMVDKSPILKSGILEYFGSELLPEGAKTVDGVEVDPDKVYKVFIPVDELEKAKDSFKMLPITDDHTWLGDEGEDPKDYQVGQTGEGVYVEDGFLYVPLKFTGKDIVAEVENHEKEELSASYYNRFAKSDNPSYDFIAKDIKGNHLALVDKGRCGSDVRVLNSKGENKMAAKAKVANKAVLELDGKRIDLDRFFSEEEAEKEDGADVHADSISENEDKREIIREIMAVAGKDDSEFEGGEDEKVREVAKLAEKLAYEPSEDSETDNAKTCNEDKRELIDEIGGILKDKVDEELWRTVMAKAEKLAYEPSEDSKADNEDKGAEEEGKKDEEAKSMNYDALYARISNSFKAESEKSERAKVKAYNAARAIVGDFNPFGMSEKDLYVKALNHLSVALEGKESVAELAAMLKACSAVRSKVDNSFAYGVIGKDEREFNI